MFVVLIIYRSIFARNLVASLFVGFMSGRRGGGVTGKCYVNLEDFPFVLCRERRYRSCSPKG